MEGDAMGLFGKEKITLSLEKYSFKPGEMVKGNISLNLKKEIYARKLEVSLIGIRKTKQYSTRGSQSSYQKVYDFDLPVSGEKDYHNEQYPFELPIPSDILSEKTYRDSATEKLEDKLGAAGSLISAVTMGKSRIEWKIRAQLDIPKKLDVKKSQDIVISE